LNFCFSHLDKNDELNEYIFLFTLKNDEMDLKLAVFLAIVVVGLDASGKKFSVPLFSRY